MRKRNKEIGKELNSKPDWRQRYLKQSDEHDALKKRYREHLELLQRLVSRLSLQIDDSNPAFTNEVKLLRHMLKGQETSLQSLGDSLKKLDQLILTHQEAESTDTPSGSHSASQSQESKSAWQRLKTSVKDLLSPNTKILSEGYNLRDADAEEFPEENELKRVLEATPGYGTISTKVAEHINNLLNQLSFPESAERDLRALRLRINRRVNWYELPPTLEDLGQLILASVGKGQRQFDSFLVDLDSQLNSIQTFLDSREEEGQGWAKLGEELEGQIKQHQDQLSSKPDPESSIDNESALKSSILQQLESIALTAREAIERGETISADLAPKLNDMRARIQRMDSEQKRLRESLKQERTKALTDVLTGLPNREAFDERFEFEFQRWQRHQQACAIAVGTIDNFNEILTTFGPLSGDRTLQIVAKELRPRIRQTDFMARYRGEQFVFILPLTEAPVAFEVIDKLRKVTASLPFHFKDKRLQVTMSFGIAAFSECNKFSELLERAELAHKDAQLAGKNTVNIWQNNSEQGHDEGEVNGE